MTVVCDLLLFQDFNVADHLQTLSETGTYNY